MAQEGHSPVLIFNSPVLVLFTVQFLFSQSSFDFGSSPVFSLLLCSCVVHVVMKTAILTYHSVMDAIIRQTVRKEMTRSASLVSERVTSTEVATTWPTFSLWTVNRLSGLVNRIRNHGSNSSNKKTQNCQGTQNTGEVVSLWWKEEIIYYCSTKEWWNMSPVWAKPRIPAESIASSTSLFCWHIFCPW